MPGTLSSPSTQSPIKALGFYSFRVVINDDDYYSFTPEGQGHLFVSSVSSRFHHGCFQITGSSVQPAFTGNNTSATDGALTGTSGADGDTTVSIDAGEVYIENRSGFTRDYIVTLIGGS